MTVVGRGAFVAVPAEHPRLVAVLQAHVRLQRVQAALRACLYFTALGGGLAWVERFRPRVVPRWSEGPARFGWPIGFGALVLFVVLEWRGRTRLAGLLRDESTGHD